MSFENEIIKETDKDNIEFIQYKRLLAHNIKHAYVLSSHDMNFRLGKDFWRLELVKNNLKILCDNCGFDYNKIIRPDFNHTANVVTVDEVDNTNEVPELSGKRFKDVDGFITNKKDITLMTTNADCLLILLYDPTKNVIANVHSGWRGTFGKIVLNAVNKMKEEFGCDAKDIEAYLSPSIRKCHFKVSDDVKELCEETFEYTNMLDQIIETGEVEEGVQKYYIDNVLLNKLLLKEAGVLGENIIDSEICSVCSKDRIHSRRVEGERFGLGGQFIALS